MSVLTSVDREFGSSARSCVGKLRSGSTPTHLLSWTCQRPTSLPLPPPHVVPFGRSPFIHPPCLLHKLCTAHKSCCAWRGRRHRPAALFAPQNRPSCVFAEPLRYPWRTWCCRRCQPH